jgi:hypothetical protein
MRQVIFFMLASPDDHKELHGIGPNPLITLRAALKAQGLSFNKE